jgi:hypothetical protein
MIEARRAVRVPFFDLRSADTELALRLDETCVGARLVLLEAGADR